MTEKQEPVTQGEAPTTYPTPRQPQARSSINVSTVAGLVTAALAITAAFWFGLLSYAATIAYEPAGVRPREIGLSSGTVLTQSAVGLVAFVVVYAVLFLPVYALRSKFWPRRPRPLGLTLSLAGLLVVVASVVAVVSDARQARDALQDGRRAAETSFFPTLGASRPWSGEIAQLDWVPRKPAGAPELPTCALYLGEAGGTAVIYSPDEKRTWRLPSSALIVRAKPDDKSC